VLGDGHLIAGGLDGFRNLVDNNLSPAQDHDPPVRPGGLA
jgi:hypothetical protein